MTTDLKPCPFCGGARIAHYASPVGRRFRCLKCVADGPPARPDIRGSTPSETDQLRTEAAVEAWNRRAVT